MLQLYRRFLGPQPLTMLCARSMGKMNQLTWKPKKNKNFNRHPKFSIILKESFESLGVRGQMVQVERGYARNYLIPKGIALYPTKENIEKYLMSSEEMEKSDPSLLVSREFSKFLNSLHLEIERKEGTDFLISEHQLSFAYRRKHQLVVPPHCIKLDEPITSFGEYTINVEVRDNVIMPMKVTVKAWKPIYTEHLKNLLEESEQEKKS